MAHIPNIHALNSDTHTLFLSILILNSQCVGVAIEGMDIWYMGLITIHIITFTNNIYSVILIIVRSIFLYKWYVLEHQKEFNCLVEWVAQGSVQPAVLW